MRKQLKSLVARFNWRRRSIVRKLPAHKLKLEHDMNSNPCGLCGSSTNWVKVFNYPSADVDYAEIYMHLECGVLQNLSAQSWGLEEKKVQSKWVDEGFYSLPSDESEFNREAMHAAGIFPWLEEELGVSLRNSTLLEIGSGSGLRSAGATAYFNKVYTFDTSAELISQINSRELGKSVTVISDAELWKFPVDWIVGWHVFEHLLDPAKVFMSGDKVLNPGGGFFFQVPLLTSKNVFPGHHFFFTEQSLLHFFSKIGKYEVRFYYDLQVEALTCLARKCD